MQAFAGVIESFGNVAELVVVGTTPALYNCVRPIPTTDNRARLSGATLADTGQRSHEPLREGAYIGRETVSNRYPGKCESCGQAIKKHEGILERAGRRWILRCQPCYDQSDNSSNEDACCGDRANEDACAARCGC